MSKTFQSSSLYDLLESAWKAGWKLTMLSNGTFQCIVCRPSTHQPSLGGRLKSHEANKSSGFDEGEDYFEKTGVGVEKIYPLVAKS